MELDYGIVVHKDGRGKPSIDFYGTEEEVKDILDILQRTINSECKIVMINREDFEMSRYNILELQTLIGDNI